MADDKDLDRAGRGATLLDYARELEQSDPEAAEQWRRAANREFDRSQNPDSTDSSQE